MNEGIFRKKSLDKIKSPESLNDYVRVSNPKVWLVIAAAVILIAGACVWGIFGRTEIKTAVTVHVEDGHAYCVTKDSGITDEMTVKIGKKEYRISDIDKSGYNGYRHITVASEGLPDGVYEGSIIIERVNPIPIFN